MSELIVSVSGVRGIVGQSLTPEVAREFGSAFAAMVGAGSRVTIARDTRTHGPEIQAGVVEGLMAGGVSVINLGVVSTPGAALMTNRLDVAGGVIITASHNPAEYNGIKFLQPSGPALAAADAEKLKAIWQAKEFAPADTPGTLSKNDRTHAEHIEAVCNVTDVELIRSKKFTVVVDSINGAGCAVTPMLLEQLGCQLVHLNGEPSGEFAHKPEPIAQNLTDLGAQIPAAGAQVGFAQDPDADRLVVVDETGVFIGEEYTLALATAFVLSGRTGKIATNMVTSRMVDDIAAAADCSVVRSPTGEANVVEAMQREGCLFGGEGNGGVIDPRVVPVRDSLVGMAMVLQFMAQTGKSVSELVADIPRYTMLKDKMGCPADLAAKVVDAARERFAALPDARVDESDGLRVDITDGWVSVRASNTEPIIRVTTEAADPARAQALQQELRDLAESIVG